jgi:uncharacterized membrane protein
MTGSTNGHSSPSGAETTGVIVVALFEERSEAEGAIRDLKNAGFTNEQIGVATQDRVEAKKARSEGSVVDDEAERIVEETATGLTEGAAAGAVTGSVIGGLVGLVSSLLIPGLGPLVIGGILASTLMGMGVGAATGGLIGALVGMGVPEEDARYFDAGLRDGRTLLTVSGRDRAPQAVAILERHGADLGPSQSRGLTRSDQYEGQERRSGFDAAYAGPERRLIGV